MNPPQSPAKTSHLESDNACFFIQLLFNQILGIVGIPS